MNQPGALNTPLQVVKLKTPPEWVNINITLARYMTIPPHARTIQPQFKSPCRLLVHVSTFLPLNFLYFSCGQSSPYLKVLVCWVTFQRSSQHSQLLLHQDSPVLFKSSLSVGSRFIVCWVTFQCSAQCSLLLLGWDPDGGPWLVTNDLLDLGINFVLSVTLHHSWKKEKRK